MKRNIPHKENTESISKMTNNALKIPARTYLLEINKEIEPEIIERLKPGHPGALALREHGRTPDGPIAAVRWRADDVAGALKVVYGHGVWVRIGVCGCRAGSSGRMSWG